MADRTWSQCFAAHLRERNLSQQDAAIALKVSASKVHYWTHTTTPREKTRRRIERWSKGAVPANLPSHASGVSVVESAVVSDAVPAHG